MPPADGTDLTTRLIRDAAEPAGRRVLMMCYFFPPIHAVGANRSAGFALHLPDFGWTPTVLSVTRTRIRWERGGAPVPAGVEIVRAPEWNLDRLVTLSNQTMIRASRLVGAAEAPAPLLSSYWIPDPQAAWFCASTAIRLARRSDCVYVSCSPFSAAVTGAWVARRTRKPLVLDFRDPWMGPGLQPWLQRWATANASALILNTPRALAAYQEKYPDLASRMVAIPNGFDTLPVPKRSTPAGEMFTIMHVGEFYGSRQPDTFLEVLAELDLPDVEFVQVGPTPTAFTRFASRLRIRHIDTVPREQALELMAQASALYLKMHRDEAYTPLAVPAKAYEYLASGVPLLAECVDGAAKDLIRDYGTGSAIMTPDDKASIRAGILSTYHRRHEPMAGVNPRFAEHFNRRTLTARLAAVFDAVVAGGSPQGRVPVMTHPAPSLTDGKVGLRQRAVTSTLWFGGSRVVTQVTSWLITIEIVRLLSPADYGLFGYAILVAAFIDLIAELGLGAAIVHRRDLTETDLETVFWLSITMALAVYALTWVGAPLVAGFFNQPMLAGVLRLSMLTFVISSIRVIPWNLLTKRVDFKHRSVAEMIATIIGSLTTLMLALANWGVWALVGGLVVRHSALTVACLVMQPWRPRGRFSRDSMRRVLGFGVRASGGRVAWYLYSKADYLVVGKLLGQQALGYYTLVFEFASMPVDRISTIINQVAFPVYAELQDRPEPFKRLFLTAATVISIVTFPLMAGLAGVADVAVPVLLTARWAPITVPLQIMCVMGAVISVSALISPAVIAKGYPGLDLRFNLLCLVVLPPGFLVGAKFGLIGVCCAWAILFPLVTAVWFRITRGLIGYEWRELADALAPAAVSAAVMGIVLLAARAAMDGMAPTAWKLALLIGAGAVTYGAALYVGFRARVLDVVQTIRPVI